MLSSLITPDSYWLQNGKKGEHVQQPQPRFLIHHKIEGKHAQKILAPVPICRRMVRREKTPLADISPVLISHKVARR